MEPKMLISDNYIIQSLPKTVIYISDFITENEENEILSKVYTAPKPKWNQLKNRRLQNWGGIPHVKGMIREKIPMWLQKYMDKIDHLGVFENSHSPNHVLINEYTANQGIMPHIDGPLFFPVISTISCGSHTLLHFYSQNISNEENVIKKQFTLLLEPRSLLVLKHNLYTDYLHGIDETSTDILDNIDNLNFCNEKYVIGQHLQRSTRISLTIRNVPKCSNFKLNL